MGSGTNCRGIGLAAEELRGSGMGSSAVKGNPANRNVSGPGGFSGRYLIDGHKVADQWHKNR